MRVITVNVNGIRAAATKGFYPWLLSQNADVICVQETKAQKHQLADEHFCPEGYHCVFEDAQKPGYSGVAIFSKRKPDKITRGLGWPCADTEGRYIQADFGKLSVASLYLPSGSSSEDRQAFKFEFMKHYLPILEKQRKQGREFILCGDWNIAHQKIDLKNWRSNQKNSGFLPEERAWLDEVFGSTGYVDAFRVVNQEAEQYTWWSYRNKAWDKNVGWRIDYHIVTPGLISAVQAASIYKDERFSDHAPLIIDYDEKLIQELL